MIMLQGEHLGKTLLYQCTPYPFLPPHPFTREELAFMVGVFS
jgi:hypothetical protein